MNVFRLKLIRENYTNKMTKRGKLISIEGGDGSGKKTQAEKLVERLKKEGFLCEMMSFPRYDTPTGRIVGQCYLGKQGLGEGNVAWFGKDADSIDPMIASLYYAADRRAARDEINKIIGSGVNLILDRYVESNMAHQAGKETNPEKRREIIKAIDTIEYGVLKLPRPDLTIFLHMPSRLGMQFKFMEKGVSQADIHEMDGLHLHRAEETYLELAERYNWTKIECTPDGTMISLRSIEGIAEEVYGYVRKAMDQ